MSIMQHRHEDAWATSHSWQLPAHGFRPLRKLPAGIPCVVYAMKFQKKSYRSASASVLPSLVAQTKRRSRGYNRFRATDQTVCDHPGFGTPSLLLRRSGSATDKIGYRGRETVHGSVQNGGRCTLAGLRIQPPTQLLGNAMYDLAFGDDDLLITCTVVGGHDTPFRRLTGGHANRFHLKRLGEHEASEWSSFRDAGFIADNFKVREGLRLLPHFRGVYQGEYFEAGGRPSQEITIDANQFHELTRDPGGRIGGMVHFQFRNGRTCSEFVVGTIQEDGRVHLQALHNKPPADAYAPRDSCNQSRYEFRVCTTGLEIRGRLISPAWRSGRCIMKRLPQPNSETISP